MLGTSNCGLAVHHIDYVVISGLNTVASCTCRQACLAASCCGARLSVACNAMDQLQPSSPACHALLFLCHVHVLCRSRSSGKSMAACTCAKMRGASVCAAGKL